MNRVSVAVTRAAEWLEEAGPDVRKEVAASYATAPRPIIVAACALAQVAASTGLISSEEGASIREIAQHYRDANTEQRMALFQLVVELAGGDVRRWHVQPVLDRRLN